MMDALRPHRLASALSPLLTLQLQAHLLALPWVTGRGAGGRGAGRFRGGMGRLKPPVHELAQLWLPHRLDLTQRPEAGAAEESTGHGDQRTWP